MHRVTLPIDLRSAATARQLLRQTLHEHQAAAVQDPGVAAGTVADALLMLSELVTNAVRHTRAVLLLEISIRGNTLSVAVVDDAPGLPSTPHAERYATSGRGLQIVDTLADRWGVTPGLAGKTVWFEITLR